MNNSDYFDSANSPVFSQNDDIYIKQRSFDRFETAFAWLCILFGYLFCLAFPPFDNPLGVVIVHTAALASTAIVLAKRGARFGVNSVASAIISFLFAFSLIFTSNELIVFLSSLCAAIAFCYFIYAAADNCIERSFSDFVIIDLFHALIVYPFFSFGKLFKALLARKNKSTKWLVKAVVGLIIAIVPTVIVISYLSYDSAFMTIIGNILDVFRDINLINHIFSLLFGCVIALYFFGAYTTATNEEKTRAIEPEDVRHLSQSIRIAPAITVACAILPIITVYVLFFVSQWQYYISGFAGRLPEGILSYAEYARDGFFELCSVSIINFIILVVVSLFLRRNGRSGQIFLKAASVILSLMTLILIGTAMAKMYLYIDRFGLTEKRLLSSWFMILLALIFVLVTVRQFVPKLKIIAAGSTVLAAMLILLVWCNHNKIIAEYNVDMFINGNTETVDIEMLEDLGSSSRPALVRLAEFWDEVELNEAQLTEKKDKYDWVIGILKADKARLEKKSSFAEFSVPDSCALDEINDYFRSRVE